MQSQFMSTGGPTTRAWMNYAGERGSWDEMIDQRGHPRDACKSVLRYLSQLGGAVFERQKAADLAVRAMGITFTVYSDAGNIDRAWPFDVIPRVISAGEWAAISRGLEQRLRAINLFIADIYHDQHIVKDKVFPGELLHNSANFRPQCVGIRPAGDVWAHICGSDLVRDQDGTMYVLEDNLRVPSGVSYMLENRSVTKRVFPDLFRDLDIRPVDSYPQHLFELLAALSPRHEQHSTPTIALLTPGIYNSAYFEHCFLAEEMGAHLVEGQDLLVGDDDCVYMRTISGLVRVDVIYRRVDDTFLDPAAFREDSTLGVPGLLNAWRAGRVAIANAPGAGVADDKVVYAFVPAIIRYYLGEDPLIPNVPTFVCSEDVQRRHVMTHLDQLIVKPANESGGYGLFVGPEASKAEQEAMRSKISADPRNYIAQPMLRLSTAPTLCEDRLAPRHLDLRPFVLSGEDRTRVTEGGLTRVALREGSMVVNSSQGGGSKDTWVLEGP